MRSGSEEPKCAGTLELGGELGVFAVNEVGAIKCFELKIKCPDSGVHRDRQGSGSQRTGSEEDETEQSRASTRRGRRILGLLEGRATELAVRPVCWCSRPGGADPFSGLSQGRSTHLEVSSPIFECPFLLSPF